MRKLIRISIILLIIVLTTNVSFAWQTAFEDSNVTRIGSLTLGEFNALDVEGNIACLANADYLVIVDISNPKSPVQISKSKLINNDLNYHIDDIYVYDKYAFILAGNLFVVDISNPENPIEIGFLDIDYTGRHMVISNNQAYIITYSTGSSKLINVDLSYPSQPGVLASIGISNFITKGVAIADSFVYMITPRKQGTLTLVDFSNPTEPKLTDHLIVEEPGTYFHDIEVIENFAFISVIEGSSQGFHIFDISNPRNPVNTGFLTAAPGRGDFYVTEQTLYYVKEYELLLIDVSDLTKPKLKGLIKPDIHISSFSASGNIVYIAGEREESGLHIIEIKDTLFKEELGYYPMLGGGDISALYYSNNYLFCLADRGVGIIDVYDPSKPIEVGFCILDSVINTCNITDKKFGKYIYEGVEIVIDFTTPTNPKIIGKGCDFSDNYAYIPTESHDKLIVVDFSTPTTPQEVASVNFENGVYNIDISGNLAHLANGAGGLEVIDISNPVRPEKVGHFDEFAAYVAVSGNYAYVGYGWGSGFGVLDVSVPNSIQKIGQIELGAQYSGGIIINSNYAYQAEHTTALNKSYLNNTNVSNHGYSHLNVFDISVPSDPRLAGYYHVHVDHNNIGSMCVADNYIFVKAEDENAILILQNDLLTATEVTAASSSPSFYNIDQNYPNPFNPTTTIEYSLPQSSRVKLIIYDLLGRKVRVLENSLKQPGLYETTWDALDDNGSQVSSGMYFCRMEAGDFVQTIKLALVR